MQDVAFELARMARELVSYGDEELAKELEASSGAVASAVSKLVGFTPSFKVKNDTYGVKFTQAGLEGRAGVISSAVRSVALVVFFNKTVQRDGSLAGDVKFEVTPREGRKSTDYVVGYAAVRFFPGGKVR